MDRIFRIQGQIRLHTVSVWGERHYCSVSIMSFIPILNLILTNISSRGRLSSRKKGSALNSSVSKLKELYEAVLMEH